jgi:hypothetical protein
MTSLRAFRGDSVFRTMNAILKENLWVPEARKKSRDSLGLLESGISRIGNNFQPI